MNTIPAWTERLRGQGSGSVTWPLVLVAAALSASLLLGLFGSAPEGRLAALTTHLVALCALLVVLRSVLIRGRTAVDRREAELAEMSHRLALAMEASQIGFWEVNLATDRLKWDARACRHMGMAERDGDFTEADWLAAVHPGDRGRALAAAHAAVEHEGRFVSDYRVIWPDGRVRHLRDMAGFYRGRDHTRRLVGLVWDVTADREREAEIELSRREAEAANLAKSNFLAAMSHEIRTPLTGVIGMLDLMLHDPLPERQHERAEIASASAQSLLLLLNDVLEFSKLESASLTLAPAPTDPRRLVAEVVGLMAARAEQKGLALTCRIDDAVPTAISVDALRLRQVLTNIVSNAITFTRRGHVAVHVAHAVTEAGPELRVAVADSGIGIAAADRARIFERFVQADGSPSRPAGGTGLGLAIARELVALMGGWITVESTVGRGSTFRFVIRAEPCPEAVTPKARPAAPSGPVPPPPLDVLVAEDNTTNQYLIRALLRLAGHRVSMVADGRAALDAARENCHDLILMDIQMPVMDGLAATSAIRRLPGPAGEVPIVALSAGVFAEEHARCRAAGMTACLAKPIDFDALNQVLADIAEGATRRPARPDAAE